MIGRIVCLGECMVEFSPAGNGLFRRGFAGDTFNSAWYLRRMLPDDWEIAYATCVGDDAVSDQMLDFMADAGVRSTARRIPRSTVGLYMIHLHDGERSFTYWRDTSAARQIAADPDWLGDALAGATLLLLSGITLAIVPPQDRPALYDALASARAGGTVIAFDPNLRPRLWPDAATMCAAIDTAAGIADILLPSFEDEQTVFGDPTPQATLERYRRRGARTVVVKNGPDQIRAWHDGEGEATFLPPRMQAIDTTAAGDSFNAGFLAAHARGAPLLSAIESGARLAGHVCGTPGALVDSMPALLQGSASS